MNTRATPGAVSVMMPTYNAVQYVDAAVLSVLSQHYRSWQLLAYDDHSDDGTYERLLFWASQDERIQVCRPFSSHGQYVDICNQMIADAGGEYLARLDADDITLPKRLSAELTFLQRNPAAVLVGSMALCLVTDNQGNRIISTYPWLEKIVKPVASTQVPVNEHLRTFNRMVHSSILARKDDVVAVGSYGELFPLEDWDLALKLATRGEVYVIPDVLTLKRQHDGNNSRAHPAFESALAAVKQSHGLELSRLPRVSEL